MKEDELRVCLRALDSVYYGRMFNVLTIKQMLEEIFARSFMKFLVDELDPSMLSVHDRVEMARAYKEMVLKYEDIDVEVTWHTEAKPTNERRSPGFLIDAPDSGPGKPI